MTHHDAENRVLDTAISLDGRYLAYIDLRGLHISTIDTGELHHVQLPVDLRSRLWHVAWFPDGSSLVFTADSGKNSATAWVASIFGGDPRQLLPSVEAPAGSLAVSPAVSPDGKWVAFVSADRHEVWLIGTGGQNAHKLLSGGTQTFEALAWSPNSTRIAYATMKDNPAVWTIESVSLDSGPPRVAVSSPQRMWDLVWTTDGRIIFDKYGGLGDFNPSANLWAIKVDPRTGSNAGGATQITNWTGVSPFYLSVSKDGKRLAMMKNHVRDDIYVGEIQAGGKLDLPSRLTVSESWDYPRAWMPDNLSVLFESNRTGREQIFQQQLQQDTAVPLVEAMDDESHPQLSPDRTWILYWSYTAGTDSSQPATKSLTRIPLARGSPQKILEIENRDDIDFGCPSASSASCILSRWEQGRLIFYRLDPLQGQGMKVVDIMLRNPADVAWSVSPDGAEIAVTSHEFRDRIRVLNAQNSTQRDIPIPGGWGLRAGDLVWTADGQALFIAAYENARFFIARIGRDGVVQILVDGGRSHWLGYPCPSPDGRYLAFSRRTDESNAWLLENF